MSSISGRRIGRYELIEELGRGGMARVYRARDTQLQRIVALKVLAAQLSMDAEFIKRFEREARTAANLRHPNIVTVYDIGEDQGLHYIAMEYIDGLPLHTILERHVVLGLGYAIALLEPIAAALDYAHHAGAVHRDIKPHNIMVDRNGRVVLTDFGIAQTPETDDQRLTRTGVFMGTPEYISPEQAEARRVDGRSDLYSLAVVAYEIIAGRVPFSGPTPQLIVAHAQLPPPPISSIAPDLPTDLDLVLTRALAKRPERRFQTGAAFIAALRDIADRNGIVPATAADLAALVALPALDQAEPTIPALTAQPRAMAEPPAPQPAPSSYPPAGSNRPAALSASVVPNRPAAPPNAPNNQPLVAPPAPPAKPPARRNTPAHPYEHGNIAVPSDRADQLPFFIIGGILLVVAIALIVFVARSFSDNAAPPPAPTVPSALSPTLAVPLPTATATFTTVPTAPPTATPLPTDTPSPVPPSPTAPPPPPPPVPTVTPSPTETPTLTVTPSPTLTGTPATTGTPTPEGTPATTSIATPTETATPLPTPVPVTPVNP
ncbi:serine/threonine-protein kinase [uncultured Chloroflexus sp.]|uniref:serine/threonine-protein kinase n=1 Tax=uncultured Chloroflexus sp. TaxID=214040 RepID=UPI00261F9FEB|nr:serine/threonine-protein kinase [uncultured Chloroflexus sp.]